MALPERETREEDPYPWHGLSLTLPPDESPPIPRDPPGILDIRTGRMTGSFGLASQLHWKTTADAARHAQVRLFYGDRRPTSVDVNIAPLIDALWRAGYVTLASCEGHETVHESAYIMFCEPIGKRFMSWVELNKEALTGALTRGFELLLQDDGWHRFMAQNYPLLEEVEPDAEGRIFTICWRLHRRDLLMHRDMMIELLRAP